MTTEIPVAAQGGITLAAPRQFDLSPQTFEQALTLAEYLAKSDMVPPAFKGKPGNCLVAMQWGFEVGLKTLQALQGIAVINGKPNLYGDAGKALLLANGCQIEEDDIEVIKKTNTGRCKITRQGRRPVERTFSMEDARVAGLLSKDGPWKTYPQRQLMWRAFWFAARDAAADILRGMGGAEEAADHIERHLGDADVVGAPPPPPPPPRPELEPYPQASLDANLDAWRKAIELGRKNPDEIIAMVSTKGVLSDEQKDQIRKLQPIENGASDPFATTDQGAPT